MPFEELSEAFTNLDLLKMREAVIAAIENSTPEGGDPARNGSWKQEVALRRETTLLDGDFTRPPTENDIVRKIEISDKIWRKLFKILIEKKGGILNYSQFLQMMKKAIADDSVFHVKMQICAARLEAYSNNAGLHSLSSEDFGMLLNSTHASAEARLKGKLVRQAYEETMISFLTSSYGPAALLEFKDRLDKARKSADATRAPAEMSLQDTKINSFVLSVVKSAGKKLMMKK